MIGRVAAVLLLSFTTISSAVFGQCNYQAARSLQFRASYFDAVVEQNLMFVANGYGIAVYDTTNGTPVFLNSIALPGPTRVVARGTYTYAGSGNSLIVLESGGCGGSTSCAYPLFIAGRADFDASVNDIAVSGSILYIATSNAVREVNVNDFNNPTGATFATTGTNVTSLALDGNTLYVADSDNTVDVFSVADPAHPQKTGTIASLPRVTGVHVRNGYLYATDGNQTEIFLLGSSPTKIATLAFGTTSFTPIGGEVVAVAGTDRRLRIVDLTTIGTPVDLFGTDLAPSAGSINRIGAIASSPGRLYIAAGDIGLMTYDISAFTSPFPLRSYAVGSTSSTVTTPDRIYATPSTGGITEFKQDASGNVTQLRQWDTKVYTVYDVANGFLLTSTGSTLTYWTLVPTNPNVISTASFTQTIKSAVVIGSNAYVTLADQTLWLVDLSVPNASTRQLSTPAQHPLFVARSGSSLAIADARDDGTTGILNYRNGSTLETPRTANVPGVVTTFAHGGNLAAVFTFRGITVVDLSTGGQTLMSQSSSAIPTSLAIDGDNILATTSSSLIVWNGRSGARLRTIPLPGSPADVAVPDPASGFAAVATSDGIASVAYASQSQLPSALPWTNGNAYYKKVLAAKDRLYLFDGRGTDVLENVSGFTPRYLKRIEAPSPVDVAATDSALFVLTSNSTVYAFAPDGTPIAQRALADPGSDTKPLSIAAAAGAPWVSLSQGCLTGTCQNNTLVLDPQTLATTSTLTGAIADVTTAGSRAYAITRLPSEIRVIDVGDPQHPAVIASRATEGTNGPVSIAYLSGLVYVLGEKLYSYNEAGLTKAGELNTPLDAATYADQRIAINGSCVLVTGRAATTQLYIAPSFAPAGSISVPALVKSVAISRNNAYLLTEDSLEIWSTGTATPAPRHRAVR